MEGSALEQLRQQRQDVDRALAEVRRQTKDAKRKERDALKSLDRAWRLSGSPLHTALIIYSLAGYVVEPAVKFLIASGRKRHWPEKSEMELQTVVEDEFLKIGVAELNALVDVGDSSDSAAMKAALVYAEQWRVVVWTRRLNTEQGVAPSTDSVLQRLSANSDGLPEDVRPPDVGCVADARARMWARRWRRRWGGRHAKVRVREDIPLPELRSKDVRKNMCPCHIFSKRASRKM